MQMKTIIYTLLIVMAIFSGFFAISGSDKATEKPTTDSKGKDFADIFAIGKSSDNRAMVRSKIIALLVYLISVASIVTVYLIKG